MVKVKNLEDGQDVYLVNVEEKSICCGSIVKKPRQLPSAKASGLI